MSLVRPVSSADGVDHEPYTPGPESVGRSVRRILSYDAFPPPASIETQTSKLNVAPYKVSIAKRFAQVAFSVLACWLASGIVFGFAALKPVLLSEGVYHDVCEGGEPQEQASACFEQELRLNIFYTVSSITANVSALPVGALLDRFGARSCSIIGCFLLAIGSLLMALSFTVPKLDAYILSNFFLALGGTFIFLPSFKVADAFPKYSGTIVALVTGAFDASAAVFLFYQIVYVATDGLFTPEKFFYTYLIVPLLILVGQLALMPRRGYQTIPQLEAKMLAAKDAKTDVHDSDDEIESDAELRRVRSNRANRRHTRVRKLDEVLGDAEERQHRADKDEEIRERSGVWGVLHGQPAHKQLLSPWFILITLLTTLQMLRMNYFIATISAQYTFMLGSESKARHITDVFNIALPLAGVMSTPFIGLLLDNLSVITTLAILVGLITVTGALNCVPTIWAGYMTVVLFVIVRPLYYSAMSDYATKVFGFASFGRVYGTIICISGLVNFVQIAMDALTQGPFAGDPTLVNITTTVVAMVLGIALVSFVALESRRQEQKQRWEEDEFERERLIVEE